MKAHQFLLGMLLATTIGAIADTFGEDKSVTLPVTSGAQQLPIEGKFPSMQGAVEWLNSPPLTPASLRGKVVLIDFWTYTCINWRRTLPYVHAWAGKYEAHGLVVIGVHTPEFGFEKDLVNVHQAAREIPVDYPVAIDSNYAVWNAFGNRYWPALYLIDAQGRIRYHHFGEGNYEQSEAAIQQLLTEAGNTGFSHELATVSPGGVELGADWDNLKSPENFLGYERTENFAAAGAANLGRHRVYVIPARLALNQWSLSGDWTHGAESVVLNKANGRIAYRFHARDVNLIMGAPAPGASVRFRVLIDGQPPGAAHGVDVDEQGNGTVGEPRMYQLIRQQGPITDRQFEIEFLEPAVKAFDFTFG